MQSWNAGWDARQRQHGKEVKDGFKKKTKKTRQGWLGAGSGCGLVRGGEWVRVG